MRWKIKTQCQARVLNTHCTTLQTFRFNLRPYWFIGTLCMHGSNSEKRPVCSLDREHRVRNFRDHKLRRYTWHDIPIKHIVLSVPNVIQKQKRQSLSESRELRQSPGRKRNINGTSTTKTVFKIFTEKKKRQILYLISLYKFVNKIKI